MGIGSPPTSATTDSRRFARLNVRCRARIRIGKREYAGAIENISSGGAKIVTLTPIRGSGPVYLMLPDLPPLLGRIRWLEPYGGGVCFELALTDAQLAEWANSRRNMLRSVKRDAGDWDA